MSSDGDYQLEVYVNGEKMANEVVITCAPFPWSFDRNECHPSITISEDGQKASINGGGIGNHISVLGSTPMRHGTHVWKVKIGRVRDCHMLGVASKPLSTCAGDYNTVACCWYSSGGAFYRDGVQQTGSPSAWSGNDTLQLELDCDRHTLRITNLRSGETCMFTNLPAKEYFQYANLYNQGNSVEFVA